MLLIIFTWGLHWDEGDARRPDDCLVLFETVPKKQHDAHSFTNTKLFFYAVQQKYVFSFFPVLLLVMQPFGPLTPYLSLEPTRNKRGGNSLIEAKSQNIF